MTTIKTSELEVIHDVDPQVLVQAEILGIKPADVLSTTVLDGGRGRRTWLVKLATDSYVLRNRQFLGDEDVATTVAAQKKVGPAVIASNVAGGLLLTQWIDGQVPSGNEIREHFLPELAQALATLHSITNIHGQPITEVVSGIDPLMTRADYLASIKRVQNRPSWVEPILELDELDAIGHRLARIAGAQPMVLIHGDPVPGNIVVGADGLKFVDFEFAGAGNALYEVGHAVAGLHLSGDEIEDFACHYGDAQAAPVIEAWSYLAAQAWAVWVAMGTAPGTQSPMWQEWAQHATVRLMQAHQAGRFAHLMGDLA